MTSVENLHADNKVHPTESKPEASSFAKPPRDLSVTAFIITLFFNHICGFFALYFTVSAKHLWKQSEYPKSERHAKYSAWFIVLGIFLGLATYALALSLFFTLRSESKPEDKVYSSFCCTAPPMNQFGERIAVESTMRTICQASGSGPVYVNQTGMYNDCCMELCAGQEIGQAV